jgi:hypothetical protein
MTVVATSVKIVTLAPLVFAAAAACVGQSGTTACPILDSKNGQVVTVQATVRSEPHDMAIDIDGCNFTVLAAFPRYSDNGFADSVLRRDDSTRKFLKVISSEYKSRGRSICEGCSKYDVSADLTGILQVATMPAGATKDSRGFIHDANGKFIGIYGWGHPAPFAGYRLIIESASNVKARKLPRPE